MLTPLSFGQCRVLRETTESIGIAAARLSGIMKDRETELAAHTPGEVTSNAEINRMAELDNLWSAIANLAEAEDYVRRAREAGA